MRNPLSDKIVDIKPSGIRKFFDIVSEMKDAISLGVGEPDFDTPWSVREEGINALEKGKTFYTSNAGLVELRQEICNFLNRKYKLSYEPLTETLVTVGGSEAIDLALRCMINPGEEVIIPQPSYVSYLPCAVMADATPVIINLKAENNFKLTAKELLDAITDKTKILILPFPNNPTGAIMEEEELKEIAKVVIEKDIFVISDEIYSELTYKNKHFSIAAIEGMKERTIVINGFSKSHAMTGWRLGYAAGPANIIKQMIKLHQFAIMCAPTNSQFAAVEALKNCDKDVEEMVVSYNQRRRFLLKEFEKMGLECFEPFGAFYVFPCIKKYNMTSEEFATRLLNEEKVAVVPGTAFGDCGEGFLRISYAYSIENLKVALDRIKNFVERLEKENA
ncbi:MAG: aminotransferase class I/II-fold pyridoxal phosphate-dependent enzyme [Lachnospiraceae bacterium]|nr:aminotransferase class I/II-fold pyridoxal phosphate-dependent enzyme [Lachnospira sp.]MBR6697238.1 aminotransferase class I/II-fold pyridoxal phosphate-dependent enzyme [Lachnospiraceae bacterium]